MLKYNENYWTGFASDVVSPVSAGFSSVVSGFGTAAASAVEFSSFGFSSTFTSAGVSASGICSTFSSAAATATSGTTSGLAAVFTSSGFSSTGSSADLSSIGVACACCTGSTTGSGFDPAFTEISSSLALVTTATWACRFRLDKFNDLHYLMLFYWSTYSPCITISGDCTEIFGILKIQLLPKTTFSCLLTKNIVA